MTVVILEIEWLLTKTTWEKTKKCQKKRKEKRVYTQHKQKVTSWSLRNSLHLSQLWIHTYLNTLWACLQSNTEVRGHRNSPCPLSRNSVMMAALQGDQGLVRLIWMSVGDIIWLSCSFPNTSSQAFTLSCGMLNTCPVKSEQDVRCLSWIYAYLWTFILRSSGNHHRANVYWMVDGAGKTHSPSSWAVVKADGRPSSSITEQLLFGSHMVPTSAMPRVSQVEAPHRSYTTTTK